ncbi:prolyl oligopeptidase family serine peptidase [uncultured Sulfitobacter sp.]|uniref:alpha/beta hydrolase family esterase n=1 Tax=uncultured Sulfitobacter sp. TaxID=191468 RepID=UPI00261FD1A0|nr:prolyl oligopeptidase family serine peptidase [uncultured Sulfitobacter sp.]
MRLILTLVFMLLAPVAQACGSDSDCTVGDRSYRISLPEGVDAPVGAVIWAHGYRGTAAGVMRNGSLRRMVHAEGLALIALQGIDGTWDLPNGPRTPDSTGAVEFDYVAAVIADAQAQYGVDPARLVASGFSAGGMLVWNLACARPDLFIGFVPYAGTFWMQPPAECATPAKSLIHIHGDADSTVPLDGRAIGPTRQGKVSTALTMYSALGDFGAAEQVDTPALRCTQQANSDGDVLAFCLFQGGHSFRTEYLGSALERLRLLGKL